MAELTCKDGTVIQISDETEAELRKAFKPKLYPPYYKDANITIKIDIDSESFPVDISTDGDRAEVSRDVADIEELIVALQEAVTYCKKHNLGVN